MSIEQISLRLVGIGPMLMRNSRLGDPLDPIAKQIDAVTRKSEKTEADHMRVAELEFHGSLYMHNGAPCLPANMVKSVCVDGAKPTRMGNTTKAAYRADGPALLHYDGPKTAPELWKDERFRFRTTVRIRKTGSLTVRTRPMFDGWSAVIHGTFLTSLLDREDIVGFYRVAGLYGLGDYTPEFGRFQVEEVVK